MRYYKIQSRHWYTKIGIFAAIILGCIYCSAQCLNYTDLTAPNVICTSGTSGKPFQDTAYIPLRHNVENCNYCYDPFLGFYLTILPPGRSNSVRLGNYYGIGQSEAVEYNFTVDPQNPVINLKLATVFQGWPTFGCTPPKFIARVLNTQGELIDNCAEYEVSIEHLEIPINICYDYVFLPWTDIAFDLTRFSNQNVKLQLINYGSDWCGYNNNNMNQFAQPYYNFYNNFYNYYYNYYYNYNYYYGNNPYAFAYYNFYNNNYYNYYYYNYWWYYGYGNYCAYDAYGNPYCYTRNHAYYDLSCSSNHLEVTNCTDGYIHVVAPDNFASYLWSDGSTGREADFIITGADIQINCQLTSNTGCVSTLSLYVSSTEPAIAVNEIYDTTCIGIGYNNEYYNLPAQMREGEYAFPNSIYTIDENGCTKVEDMMLYLTVLADAYTITDDICEGEGYYRHGFNITAEQIQTIIDGNPLETGAQTLTFTNEYNDYGCVQSVTLNLRINEALELPTAILGPTNVCTGEEASYTLADAGTATNYNWLMPANVQLLEGQGTPSVTLTFREGAAEEVTLYMEGSNGCGISRMPLTVHTHPVIYNMLADTICSGETYEGYGFHLVRQDSAGMFNYINSGQTAWGCDSFAILSLLVGQTPTLTVTTSIEAPILCSGEEVTINCTDLVMTPPEYAIGNILCTDSSCYAPSGWRDAYIAGKKPMGIIFYVDSTGEHGWAVSLGEAGITNCNWASISENTLFPIATERSAISYLTGEDDTNILANYFGNVQPQIPYFGNYPAAAIAYYYDHSANIIHLTPKGWFLPSAGQLRILFANLPEIENSLTLLASMGETVETFDGINTGNAYWSSTPATVTNAWVVEKDGQIKSDPKQSGAHRVRSIRAF